MTEQRPTEQQAGPAGEHIHMPEPSILPLLNAIGLAGVIVSITLSIWLVIAAGILFAVTTVIWIRSTAREVNDLPLENH
jgi:Flp pilus assembly protein TadB